MLVVDDHQMFTHALTTVLSQDGRFEVVGTAATGREAVKAAKSAEADVVLMDCRAGARRAGRDAAAQLDPAPCVIALSATPTGSRAPPRRTRQARNAFVTKSEAFDELVATIVAVYRRA